MTSSWIGIVIGACLILQQQGILAQFVNPDCGQVFPQNRILGGKAANLGSAPFMVYLMNNNIYRCGGTIVNKRYILTAASCVHTKMTVRLGEYDDRTDPDCVEKFCVPRHRDFDVSMIAYHRDYNNVTLANDIALIKLREEIEFQVNIQPICLLQFPGNATRPNEYQAFGWGATSAHGSASRTLQTTKVRHFPNTYCKQLFRRNLTHNQICAGSRESDTCNGDSGSPLVTHGPYAGVNRFVQLGIVSYGNRRCTGAGVYTNVPNYGAWILDKMQILDKN